jgi:hypothetical protein
MIKLAALTTLAVSALPAMAAEYVLGRDYQPCVEGGTRFNGETYMNCVAPNTQHYYQEVFTDDNGMQKVREIEGRYEASCGNNGVCSMIGSTTYERGSYVGDAPKGHYLLTYKFYMGEDYNGNPVAYAVGRGPKFKEDPVGNPWANEPGGAPVAPGSENWDEDE